MSLIIVINSDSVCIKIITICYGTSCPSFNTQTYIIHRIHLFILMESINMSYKNTTNQSNSVIYHETHTYLNFFVLLKYLKKP